jgi:asparagine synthase (glutamine-hydrolysing)
MSGIVGMFDFESENRISEQMIDRMTDAISHRGPDGRSKYVNPCIGIGFTRLGFIDLAGGMQPIWNERSDTVMVCDGEIFNFKALRKELEDLGHHFRTKTDVEVVLHLYEEYGENMVKRLNGQYAFIVYNINTREVFCARDHMGIAPFFYTICDGFFLFASEIKSILEYPGIERKLNLRAIDQLLTFPGVRAPDTFFKNIYSLENGHYLKFRYAQEVRQIEYWDVRFPSETKDKGEQYYKESLLSTLEESVRLRLHAEAPLGFYISGGLDSSIIAGLISKITQTPYHSFSIDFSDRGISESRYQRLLQHNVKSIHHKRMFSESDIVKYFKQVIYHAESPLKETYNTASIALSEMVREHGISGVLSGEGSDEFFSGYVGNKFDITRQKMQHLALSDAERAVNERVFGDPEFFYERSLTSFEQTKRQLYATELVASLDEFTAIGSPMIKPGIFSGLDAQQKRGYTDYKMRLPEHLLADHGDKMSYANSVEGRFPFLDINFLELSLEIPTKYKLSAQLDEKYILKRMAEGLIPDEIIARTKFSFVAPGTPAVLSMRDEYVSQMLSYSRIKQMGIFNADFVENLKKTYAAPGFKLNLPFDADYLIFVLTVNAFCDIFSVTF